MTNRTRTTTHHYYLSASVIALALSLSACADEAKPPLTSSSPTWQDNGARVDDDPSAKPDDDGRSGAIVVDKQIAELCKLPTLHFAFDRSKLLVGGPSTLDALANCLSTGPLKGRALALIGHADSRGESEYNFALGQRRAGSVAEYLSEHGIEGSNLKVSSRGELDATGSDSEGWAGDRKVDILLAAGTSSSGSSAY